MGGNSKGVIANHAAALTLISFFLHLLWEYGQCSLFFVHGTFPPTHVSMLLATLGDVAITWFLYAEVALYRRQWRWSLSPWRKQDMLLLGVTSVAVAIAIERFALSTGRWAYSPINPLLPGTSVSIVPILQVLLLVPLSFWLAGRLVAVVTKSGT